MQARPRYRAWLRSAGLLQRMMISSANDARDVGPRADLRSADSPCIAEAHTHAALDTQPAGLKPYEQVVKGSQDTLAVMRQSGDDLPQIGHRQGGQRGDEEGVILVLHLDDGD